MDHLLALKAYVRVIELGSFTQAARELHVKQSTVSKWIGQLEEEHHTTLIQRTSRAQRVTEAGEHFYARSKEILALYELAHAELQAHATTLSGRLRISLPVVLGERFFLKPLADFALMHPEVSLDMVFDDRYVDLIDRDLDLAIRVGEPVDSALHAITLGSMPRMLIASPCYVERRGVPRTPAQLAEHSVLLHGFTRDDPWTFHRADGTAQRVRLAPSHVSANHSGALLTLARRGFGIALLGSWLVTEDIAQGKLVHVMIDDVEMPSAQIQVLAPSPHLSLRARALVTALKTSLKLYPDT